MSDSDSERDSAPTFEPVRVFERDGFVVVPDLLDTDEIDRFAPLVDAAVRQRMSGDTRPLTERSRYEQSFLQCINLWEDHPKIRDLTFHPRIAETAADLLGATRVRLWHDQALYKEAPPKRASSSSTTSAARPPPPSTSAASNGSPAPSPSGTTGPSNTTPPTTTGPCAASWNASPSSATARPDAPAAAWQPPSTHLELRPLRRRRNLPDAPRSGRASAHKLRTRALRARSARPR
jgi:hypothetical protein